MFDEIHGRDGVLHMRVIGEGENDFFPSNPSNQMQRIEHVFLKEKVFKKLNYRPNITDYLQK